MFNYLVSFTISFKSLHIKACISILICFFITVLLFQRLMLTSCKQYQSKPQHFYDAMMSQKRFQNRFMTYVQASSKILYSFQYFNTMSTCTSNKRFHYIKSLELLFVMNQYTHNEIGIVEHNTCKGKEQ